MELWMGNPSLVVFWADDGNENSALYASITKEEEERNCGISVALCVQ